MTTYDPIYGELLNSREVADLTGYTMNQLRYFRQNPDKSPFPLLKAGTTTFYRKSDIDSYIQHHGTQKFEYVVPEGFETAPLVGSVADHARRDDITKIRNITTRNSWTKWATWVTEEAGFPGVEAYDLIETEQVRLYQLATGDDLRVLYSDPVQFNLMRKHDPFRFWPSYTYGIRSAVRKALGLDVSDQEIIDAPVGEVPPSKMD
jgi:hypothetical protein